jgi:carbamoyl-phosphate synthase large subunit
MAKLNILVSAVGGDLGQSVIKCLRDSSYRPYILGCDMNPYAGGRADVDEFFPAPPVNDEQLYTDFLLRIIEEKKINYVFLLLDVEIIFFNENRHSFRETNAIFVVSEKHIIDTFMDKYKTVEFFKEKGISYPKTWMPSQYDNQLGFPLILKRRRGSGSQRLFKVNDDQELQFYLKRHNDMIVQEYLPGEDNEYTAGLFRHGETIHTITFKRTLAPGGFSQQVELVTDESIDEFPKELARQLAFKGSINVQFRRTDRGCIPFEINPRFSSTVYFRHRFGFKDVLWCLDLYEGRRISYNPIYKYGIGVKKFSEALFDMEKMNINGDN